MSFFENDASVPFDSSTLYRPTPKSNIVLDNTYKMKKGYTDKIDTPQYIEDRDRENKIASVKEDKELNKKIVDDAQKETQKEDYDRSPINYEANKLSSGLITSIGKLFHTRI